MGLRELSRLAEVPSPQLSHWEKGTRLPKVEELAGLLAYLRVVGEEKAWFIELARNAHEPDWLEQNQPGVPPGLASFIEYERTATAVFNWQPVLIPGIFQTSAYARAIFGGGSLAQDDVEQRLMVRLARRELLRRSTLRYTALLGEIALRQGIGGDAVMCDQLKRLLTFAQLSNVTVRVLPFGDGYHPGLNGSFGILDFDDLPTIVHVEHFRCSAYLCAEDKVAVYRAAAKTMVKLSLDEAASSAVIQGVITELEE